MTRFNQLGKLMVVMGILFVLGAGFAFYKIQEGYDSLQALSAAQNVVLKYNEQGRWIVENLKQPKRSRAFLLRTESIRWSNQNWIRMIRWSILPLSTCTRWQ